MNAHSLRYALGALTVAAISAGAGAGIMATVGSNESAAGDETGARLADPGELRQEVHWHADFAIVIDGEPVVLSDERFLSTEERELSPNVHLHEPRYTVVHVHREQTTWGEFFASLGGELTDDCLTIPEIGSFCSDGARQLRFLVNGVPVDSLRHVPISDLQRVLIAYGTETEEELAARFDDLVSDEACIPSGRCAARIPPAGEEPEPCAGGTGCH